MIDQEPPVRDNRRDSDGRVTITRKLWKREKEKDNQITGDKLKREKLVMR
jgi:hypothetical protein